MALRNMSTHKGGNRKKAQARFPVYSLNWDFESIWGHKAVVKCSVSCRSKARSPGKLVLKAPELPDGFSKTFLKARCRGASQGM